MRYLTFFLEKKEKVVKIKNMKKINNMSIGKKIAIGAGVVAIGTGAFYMLGPNAKTHQKKAAALLAKMKNELEREIKKVEKVSMPLYNKAVDTISKNYAKQYKLHEKDIKAFAKKLKSKWKNVEKVAKKKLKSIK